MVDAVRTSVPKKDLVEVTRDGRMIFRFHPGQIRAWDSRAKITAVIAGSQGGKTSFGPVWLWREIREKGPGDYLIATPTMPLLSLKLLPEFKRLFVTMLKLGRLVESPVPKFTMSTQGEIAMFGEPQDTPTIVHFGHASNPDSLESMTAKAAWLDEAGQKEFRVGSYEAVLRRLAIHDGRVLITTTPYVTGWLKTRIWNRRREGGSYVKVVRFDSTENPLYPRHVYEQAKRDLPRWKFNMFYRGMFTRPAGMIYDNFEDSLHTIPRFPLPERWPRFAGLDFGGVNTAALLLAEDPGNGKLYAYREYHAGGRTAKGHAEQLLAGEPGIPVAYGGAASEQQWRDEFKAAGYPIKKPLVSDVEVGIDRVYGTLARGELIIFDDLTETLEEFNSYSRETDDEGNAKEKIDDKNKYHMLDAARYIVGSIRGLDSKNASVLFNPPRSTDWDPDEDLAWADRFDPYVTY